MLYYYQICLDLLPLSIYKSTEVTQEFRTITTEITYHLRNAFIHTNLE